MKKWKIFCKKCLFCFIFLYCAFESAIYFTTLPFDQLENHPVGLAIVGSQNDLLGLYTNVRGDHFIPLQGDIPSNVKHGILAAEDRYFYQHNGVNFLAILRAAFQNIKSFRRISGASTISMQLIRLKMNHPRTWFSKIKEAWYALKLERVYSKDEILRGYLNNAPFGSNIYGLETAALFYFSKTSKELKIDESTLLLGLPQAPSRLRPDRFLEKANKRKMQILYRMLEDHSIREAEYHLYLAQTPELDLHSNQFMDHGFMQAIKNDCGTGLMLTSIDRNIQKKLESIIGNYCSSLSIESQVAVCVIDVKTGQVVSLFEGGDSKDFISCGLSLRSSGSCLKPFIYGKAFDMSLAWPNKMVNDTAINVHGYQPRNNDHLFHQKISLKDALRLSRNIPAIELLQKVGVSKFNDVLRRLQLSKNGGFGFSGLTAAVGGISVDLLSLTNAYALLAREGRFLPYSWLRTNRMGKGDLIFSAQTVTQLKKCLLHNEQIGFYGKTGTSWGPRDVWCIGFDEAYSIGVWIGNKKGGTMHPVTGESLAYPLLSRVFSAIKMKQTLPVKLDMPLISLCTESGYRATDFCSKKREIAYVETSAYPPLCALHLHGPIVDANRSFSITSPVEEAKYLLMKKNHDLVIECNTNEAVDKTFWFINGRYKGRSAAFKLVSSDVRSGENSIAATNEKGESSKINFFVQYLD